ncbi:MAG: helix-turn-helix transcriptional regulator [Pseudobdellovibrio sp.]
MKQIAITNEKDLAKALKERRKELEITQKSLADFCNLSHNGISRIEMADSDIKLSSLIKMSKILGFKITLEMED